MPCNVQRHFKKWEHVNSMNISQLLHEMAYFRSGLRGAALLLRSGPKIKAQHFCRNAEQFARGKKKKKEMYLTVERQDRRVRGCLILRRIRRKVNRKDTLAPASSPCQWMGCTMGASWGTCALGRRPLMSPTHLNPKNRKVAGQCVTWGGPTAPNLYLSCEF